MKNRRKSKLGQDPILHILTSDIRMSPENEQLYKPIGADDPDIKKLADSIREHGVLDSLQITLDGFIVSGHRRFVAAKLAGKTSVPCRIYKFNRTDDPDRFIRLLREHNRQREKSFDEKVREEVVTVNPEEAYQSLIAHRKQASKINLTTLAIRETKRRAKISDAKDSFLNAVLKVLEDNADFLPVSDRQIHYALLNNPPLRHGSKPGSAYRNDKASYKSLVDLVTRARLVGRIPMNAIADETRPIATWDTWRGVQGFVGSELDGLLKNYWRDLMQSQPCHIEIMVEKNTVAGIVKDVAMRYCLPMTSGRGFCSLPPRHDLAERFKASGKEQLIVLMATDFDPEGEEIAHSFARSLRDDFGVEGVKAIKFALTSKQVNQFDLQPDAEAKTKSTNYKRFVAKYGNNVFELEAIPPRTLQQLATQAIDSVLDIAAFNSEVDQEKRDSTELETLRRRVVKMLGRVRG